MRFNEAVDPVFAVEFLRSAPVQNIILRQSTQSAQQNFSGPLIRALPMPLPPLELQRTFAARVTDIRALESAQVASRQKLDDLFQSLLHGAFRGQL